MAKTGLDCLDSLTRKTCGLLMTMGLMRAESTFTPRPTMAESFSAFPVGAGSVICCGRPPSIGQKEKLAYRY
jgi:hypothetical protein